MQIADAQKLRKLNLDFYQVNHASFSETRQNPWSGWERVATALPRHPISVLDVACGNLRFKSFLDAAGVAPAAGYYAVDSCASLLPAHHDAAFQQLDIVGALMGTRLASAIEAPACEIVACFGFMHHVPTRQLRMRLFDALLEKTAPGGIMALSFWQFASDRTMLAKARETTERGCLELDVALDDGDYLLGWNNVEGAYRYCHSFDDAELDAFVTRGGRAATCVDRFRADGRTGEMNGYLVFRKAQTALSV